jgi:DNA-directed RNA polymerase subunit beta'
MTKSWNHYPKEFWEGFQYMMYMILISEELIVLSGVEITEDVAKKVDESSIEEVEIRSVLTCETRRGVCAKCYGRNLTTGNMVQAGESVGVIAAQSIGEPGTQLTLRTFHVGGTASNISVEASINAKFDGIIEFEEELRWINTTNKDGEKVSIVMGRSGEIRINDAKSGKILVSNHVPYGALLNVKDGQKIAKGDSLCTWDPYNAVILSEFDGKLNLTPLLKVSL